MKSIISVLAAMLLAISGFAQDGRYIYNRYSNKDNVDAVYVSPSMFKLMGKLPELPFDGLTDEPVDIAPIIKSFESFYLIRSVNPDVNVQLPHDLNSFMSSGKYELMMEVRQGSSKDGATVALYTRGNDKEIMGLVALVKEEEATIFVSVDGRIPRERFEEILAAVVKDNL